MNSKHDCRSAHSPQIPHLITSLTDSPQSFGYLDGVSQPAVQGVDLQPTKGQETVRQGIILLGREGDADGQGNVIQRPDWALDGSFLVFRYLSQLVPEFQGFVDGKNPIGAPKDFLGARLVGRWKSGKSWLYLAMLEWRVTALALTPCYTSPPTQPSTPPSHHPSRLSHPIPPRPSSPTTPFIKPH